MRFHDREIDLNNLSFTEDRYEIEGKGIHIVAENGEFQDQKENCIERMFFRILALLLMDENTS